MQSGFIVGQLAFVNDQSRFVLPFQHLRNDLIERDHFGLNSGSKELKREVSRRQGAGDSDLACP